MDKTAAGLIGAVSAILATAPAQAATTRPTAVEAAMQASSYADLLSPIPNAVALLEGLDVAQSGRDSIAPTRDGQPTVEKVQYHHHHHHHRYHHHHHHHHGNF